MNTPENDTGTAVPQPDPKQKINDGGPAFPVPADVNPDGYGSGMTLRDHFAGLALQGIIASMAGTSVYEGRHIVAEHGGAQSFINNVALRSYDYADAMLAASERKEDA